MRQVCTGIALVLWILVVGTSAQAQDEPPSLPPLSFEDQIRQFFEAVEKGEYKAAIDQLYARNPWQVAIQDQVSTLKGQFATLPDLVGKFYGYDLIVEQPISDRFVYRWYLVSYDRMPISFRFTFYKPQEEWMIYSFKYNQDIPGLAEELGKMKLVMPGGGGELPSHLQHAGLRPQD
jgi:hypothetical protein